MDIEKQETVARQVEAMRRASPRFDVLDCETALQLADTAEALAARLAEVEAERESASREINSLTAMLAARLAEYEARVTALTAELAEARTVHEALIGAAIEEAATVDWSCGREVADEGPDYLTDWQRGLVAGQKAYREAIRAFRPDATAALQRMLREAESRGRNAALEEAAEKVKLVLMGDADHVRNLHSQVAEDREEYAEELPAAIRALAPASGVAKLAALRAERDEAVSTLAYCEKQWSESDRVTHAKMLGERARADSLTTENQRLQDRERVLKRERDEAVMFLDNAVSKAPEPLRELGGWLANKLDEDEWPTAERFLNAAAKSLADLAAEIQRLRDRERVLADFITEFAAAKIDALRYQPAYGESPEDAPDPVVEAETVWAWQEDARAALIAQAEARKGKGE